MPSKVVKGTFWSAFERFSVQGISFVVQIVLARLLVPKDYGLVGMLVVFLSISQSFIDSGFSTALIQKKNASNKDFSTVFYFNVVVSIVLYWILYAAAPFIAHFYHQPLLKDILRISGLTLIINSFAVVQRTILTIKIDFKTQSRASFTAAIISGAVAICLAYYGLGVWALVVQTLISAIINCVLLHVFSKWHPFWYFSLDRLRNLFKFGVNILISGLVYTLYGQLYILIIGKKFKANDLGCYTRADQFYSFPSSNICEILKRVYFPALCQIRDDKEHLISAYRKSLKASALIVFPLMMLFAAISEPLIRIVLTDKWLGVVWMLQLLCFRGMLFPVTTLNLNVLNVIGRSDVFLKVQLYTHAIAIMVVCLLAVWADITMLIICQIVIVYIMLGIGSIYVNKYIGYSIFNLIKDLKGVFLLSIITGSIAYWVISFFTIPVLQLMVGVGVFLLMFLSLAWILNVADIRLIKVQLLKK